MTYAAPSKRSEKLLLMTCQVKDMAPDGNNLQKRTLLDSAATCLIMENLIEKLHLPLCHSNVKIKWLVGFNVLPGRTTVIRFYFVQKICVQKFFV